MIYICVCVCMCAGGNHTSTPLRKDTGVFENFVRSLIYVLLD